MWQLLRSLRYRQPRPAIRVPRQILGSQKRKIPNVEAGSMDGFRLYCSELDEMEAKLASWCLEKLRKEVNDHWCCEPVYASSLDHGVGDPEEDGYLSEPSAHKVVIVEGNYLLLEDGAWKDVSSMFDEKWFIDVDTDTERQIVLKRHFERKASGCFKMAIHIPRSRANFSSKNRKRWQIGVQISKQQKPKITCGLRFHGYPVRL